MMKIQNKTNVPTFFLANAPGGPSDCGTLNPNTTQDLPNLDDQESVKVTFDFRDGKPSIDAPGTSLVTVEVTETEGD
jgi:hypothetical protein